MRIGKSHCFISYKRLGPFTKLATSYQEDQRHIRFLAGADLLIHDAQYTLNEFPAKEGWGHTPMERAVDYALLAQAHQLALFHHDPDRSDEAIDRLCARARDRAATNGSG